MSRRRRRAAWTGPTPFQLSFFLSFIYRYVYSCWNSVVAIIKTRDSKPVKCPVEQGGSYIHGYGNSRKMLDQLENPSESSEGLKCQHEPASVPAEQAQVEVFMKRIDARHMPASPASSGLMLVRLGDAIG